LAAPLVARRTALPEPQAFSADWIREVSSALSLGMASAATVSAAWSVLHAAGIVGSGGRLPSPAPHALGSTDVVDAVPELALEVAPAVVDPEEPPLLPGTEPSDDDDGPLDDVAELLPSVVPAVSRPPAPHAAQTTAQASVPIPDPNQ
jgi:hypothetical protein